MMWNKKARCWQSTGDLGIANMNGLQINKKVKGVFEVERKRSGDGMTLYLEVLPDLWYLFNYRRGFMQVLSSDKTFNDIIHAVKGNDRRLPAKRGEASYMFMLAEKKKVNDFMKHMQGLEVEEDENIDFEEGENDGGEDSDNGESAGSESESESETESENGNKE